MKPARESSLVAVVPTTLGIKLGKDVVQLEQDPAAPERCVRLLGGELEQEIALLPRHQGAGVEDGAVT